MWWQKFLSALFPEFCLKCQKEGNLLCSEHFVELPPPPESQADFLYLDDIFAISAYEDKIIQKLIHLLKFQGNKNAGETLGEIVNQYAQKNLPEILNNPDWIIQSIPLHFWRRFTRGFNQSEMIAQKITDKKNLPFNIIFRKKYTRQQSKLDKKSRQKNLSGAFYVPQKQVLKIKHKSILLVDDVVATGMTLDQAAKALKKAGADRVIALVVARGG
jgi:competence protein ComFC